MKRSIIFDLLKLVAVFGVIWVIFTIFPILPDKTDLKISVETEEKLGKKIAEELLSKDPSFKKISEPYLDSVFNVIELRLIEAIGYTEFEYKIILIENATINAFALPGGYIFIHSGLIEFSESPEEVAAVIAHEMGHIEKRHIIRRLIKELGITIVTSGDAVLIGEVGRTAASTVFDRKQEHEADDFALNTLYKANISPHYLGTFFRRLKSEHGSCSDNLELLSTHPHVNARIKASLEYKIEKDFKTEPFNIDWEKVRQELRTELSFPIPG